MCSIICNPCKYINNKINSFIFFAPETKSGEKYNELEENNKNVVLTRLLGLERDQDISVIRIRNDSEKCIIYSHGTGYDIVDCYEAYFKELSTNLNVDCILYDYPGYGLSTGKPTEQGCYQNLKRVINFAVNVGGFKKENIILMGNSLGTAVIMDYVSKNQWDSPVILISPFKSIVSIATDLNIDFYNQFSLMNKMFINFVTYSGLGYFLNRFDTINKLNTVTCPVKIFHGKKDDFIDISHSHNIHEKLINKKYPPTYFDEAKHETIFSFITTEHLKEVID